MNVELYNRKLKLFNQCLPAFFLSHELDLFEVGFYYFFLFSQYKSTRFLLAS